MSLKKIIASLKANRVFLITTHTNVEGDALGSEVALYRLLLRLGKRAVMINDDTPPPEYSFLPGVKEIKKFNAKLKNTKFDCFATVDCSDLSRCGSVQALHKKDSVTINIDHHISNGMFGEVNWVEGATSSTSEMIYKLYKALGVSFDKDTATLLYIGILTDTGSFRYTNTSSLTHRAVAELMEQGLNVTQIYKNIYENIIYEDMQLLARVLSRIQSDAHGKVAWFKLRASTIKKGVRLDLSEYLLNFARAIKDVEVAVLFKENLGVKNEIRVNLRSQGKVDVNRIAAYFGGGGHKTASGCTVKGGIDSVVARVLKEIREALSEHQ